MFEDKKDLLHIDFWILYTPKERWIGIRNIGTPDKVEQAWKHRVGKKQQYQLNLIPSVAIFFSITRWTSTEKKKRK